MQIRGDTLFRALQHAGLPKVPEEFSVTLLHQAIPWAALAAIDTFLRVFEQITTRPAWQDIVLASVPQIAQHKRVEACFFVRGIFSCYPTSRIVRS